jgi:Fe-S cluster assembly protein SufD
MKILEMAPARNLLLRHRIVGDNDPWPRSKEISRGVYQGCVRVMPEAQGTDARQMSRALLLSRQAEVATKPELEIFADNVKCSHGATAGELDRAALFFLRARGIPEAEARALLVEAFLGEIIDANESETIRTLVAAAVSDWLSLHGSEVSHVE